LLSFNSIDIWHWLLIFNSVVGHGYGYGMALQNQNDFNNGVTGHI